MAEFCIQSNKDSDCISGPGTLTPLLAYEMNRESQVMAIVRAASLPAIDYERVLSLTKKAGHAWSEKDAILCALGIGLGSDPINRTVLNFVHEEGLKVFPTFPVVVGSHGAELEDVGIDCPAWRTCDYTASPVPS